MNLLILIAQFYIALFPIGEEPNAEAFFEGMLSIPVLIVFIVFYIFWKRDSFFYIKTRDIDIDTGRRNYDLGHLKQVILEEKAHIRSKPFYYRIYKFWC